MLINLYSISLEVVVNLATDAYHQFEVEKMVLETFQKGFK